MGFSRLILAMIGFQPGDFWPFIYIAVVSFTPYQSSQCFPNFAFRFPLFNEFQKPSPIKSEEILRVFLSLPDLPKPSRG